MIFSFYAFLPLYACLQLNSKILRARNLLIHQRKTSLLYILYNTHQISLNPFKINKNKGITVVQYQKRLQRYRSLSAFFEEKLNIPRLSMTSLSNPFLKQISPFRRGMGFFGYFLKSASLLISSYIQRLFSIVPWMEKTEEILIMIKCFGFLVRCLHMTHASKRAKPLSFSTTVLEKEKPIFYL